MMKVAALLLVCVALCSVHTSVAVNSKHGLRATATGRLDAGVTGSARAPTTTTVGPKQAKAMAFFVKWLKANKAVLDNVKFHDFTHQNSTERGLQVTADVEAGTVLIKIPRTIIMTPARLPEHLAGNITGLDAHRRLAAYLAIEKNKKDSMWKPYIDILPTMEEYRHFHPLVATEEELSMYEGLPLVEKIRKRNDELLKAYDAIHKNKLFHKVANFTFDDFRWANVVVTSRAYAVGETEGLVPFADCANTGKQDEIQTEWQYNPGAKMFVVKAARALQKGEELLEAYQPGKDMAYYSRVYGIILPDNKAPKPLGKDKCESFQLKVDPGMLSSPLTQTLHHIMNVRCPEDDKSQPAATPKPQPRASATKTTPDDGEDAPPVVPEEDSDDGKTLIGEGEAKKKVEKAPAKDGEATKATPAATKTTDAATSTSTSTSASSTAAVKKVSADDVDEPKAAKGVELLVEDELPRFPTAKEAEEWIQSHHGVVASGDVEHIVGHNEHIARAKPEMLKAPRTHTQPLKEMLAGENAPPSQTTSGAATDEKIDKDPDNPTEKEVGH
eukprot:GFYU01003721.1.p1 GENE.GFYU01003721.1~~GFYU01003721.1.p1  ORF type:complete len:557 (-),score=194.55 GFYU01003721.1:268-1938(-)